jgi:hypothetical protein
MTLNPPEKSKAFGAELLRDVYSNANAAQIVA